MDAKINNASIFTNTKIVKVENDGKYWNVIANFKKNNLIKTLKFSSKVIVNAAGPWTDELISKINPSSSNPKKTKLIKGSHIIVPKLYNHRNAYIFQHKDGRIIFTIPYEKKFSLIGTTDINFNGDPSEAKISEDEIKYLCDAVSTYFINQIKPNDIIWTYSGVRSLFDDGNFNAKDITRDYKIDTKELNGLNYISI